jgi:excisionase family DNA binding protein
METPLKKKEVEEILSRVSIKDDHSFKAALRIIYSFICEMYGVSPPKSKSQKITRKELSEEYKISYPTILKLERDGVLKRYQLGRRVLFDRREVEEAISGRSLAS